MWELHLMVQKEDKLSLQNFLFACNKEKVSKCVNSKFKNETLLTTAIKKGALDIVTLLLNLGANPNLKSLEGGRNEPPLITATRMKNLEIVQILMRYGAELGVTGFYGHDAIFQAVVENAFPVLEYLLGFPSTKHFGHGDQSCPFQLALKYASRFEAKRKCLLTLLQNGYNCNCFERRHLKNLRVPNILDYICIDSYYFVKTSASVLILQRMTLFNLCAKVIRSHVMQNASQEEVSSRGNFVKMLSHLPLPHKILNCLQLKNVSEPKILKNHENVILLL